MFRLPRAGWPRGAVGRPNVDLRREQTVVQDRAVPCIIPADLDAAPFSRHVDLLLFGVAWDRQDAALMTDLGLQLADGERTLMRPHKALKSDQVLELSAYLAGERRDKITLARLAKAAEKRGDKRLRVIVVRQAQEANVVDSHPLADAIEDLSPAALEMHKAAIRRIRAARLAGSHQGLERLDKYFDSQTYLHKAQQEHIDKAIARAKANMPSEPVLHDLVVILDRLAAITPCER
jgi:hypothetical protein